MLYEYAVEPECISRWDAFSYLTEKFGIPTGRLISDFPSGWIEAVDGLCKEFTFMQRQVMIDELARLSRQALISSGRSFDDNKPWKQNALEQYQQHAFRAVIAAQNNSEPPYVLAADNIRNRLEDNNPLWNIPREDALPRTVDALGNAISLLLQMSKHIVFVDYKFSPFEERWKKTLAHFIKITISGRTDIPSFEYHVKIDDDEYMKEEDERQAEFLEDCNKNLSNLIPVNIQLRIVRWDVKAGIEGGEGMHARYVLTERGGVKIDWGLDAGRRGQTTDVSLMDDHLWKKRYGMFNEKATVLELVDHVSIVGTKE